MDFKEIKEKYPSIAMIIRIAQNASPENIGYYTSKIEKEGNPEKLRQWVEYWSNVNSLQAALIINKLKKDTEEKEKLKNIVLENIKNDKPKNKYYSFMLILLYFNDYEQAKQLYRYMRYILTNKINKIIDSNSFEEINSNLVTYIKSINKYPKIFLNEEVNTEVNEIEKIVKEIITNEEMEEKKKIIKDLMYFLIGKTTTMKEAGLDIRKISRARKKALTTETVSIQKLILEIEELLKQITDMKNITEKFEEIKRELEQCLEKLKKLSIKQEERTRNYIKKELELMSQSMDIKELSEKTECEIYKEIIQLKIPKKTEIKIASISNQILKELLKESNYKLIFNYIKIVQEERNYLHIKPLISKFALAPKEANKDIIMQIVNNFISYKSEYKAVEFLKNISVKKYLDYLPKNRTALEYIETIKKQDETIPIFNIQKEIFVEDVFPQYNNIQICLQKWLEYFQNNIEIVNDEMVLHMILVLLELINEDIKILENNDFVDNKIKELEEECENRNVEDIKGHLTILICKIVNKILIEDIDIKTKTKYIKKLGKLNPYRYQEDITYLPCTFKDTQYNEVRINTKNYFSILIENMKQQDLEDIIYIYMNTHVKAIIPIEELLKTFHKMNLMHIYEYLNWYRFYGRIFALKKSDIFYRFQISNVRNNYLMRIQRDEFQHELGQKTTYLADIINYSNIYHKLVLNNIRVYNKYEEEQEYLIPRISEQSIINLKENKKKIKKKKYKYMSYKGLNEAYGKEQKEKLAQMDYNKKVITEKIKNQYYEQVKTDYEELLKNKEILLEDIIYYYMNTKTRYILNIQEFIDIIAKERFPNEKVIDIEKYFREYSIIYRTINNENKLEEVLQLDAVNSIEYQGNPLKKIFINKLSYQQTFLEKYDVEQKKIITNKTFYGNIAVNSKEYKELIKILTQYVRTYNFDVLKQLKDLKTIPELENERNIDYMSQTGSLKEYKERYDDIVSMFIADLDKLKLFIEYLGENNYWKENSNFVDAWYIASSEKIRNQFREQIKNQNIRTVLDCYKNTYLKTIIPVDELLRTLFRFNKGVKNLMKKYSVIDVEKYNLTLKINIENIQKEDNYIVVSDKYKAKNLKIKIEKIRNDFEESNIVVKVQKYDTIYNVLHCTQILTDSKNRIIEYNKCYIMKCLQIFRQNPNIEDVYELIEDDGTININFYNSEVNSWYYVSTITECFKEERDKIREYFNKFIKDKITTNNVETIIQIYNRTILRYCISLKNFLLAIKEYAADNNIIETSIRLKTKRQDGNYKVYFRYYDFYGNAEIITNENLMENRNYKVEIIRFDDVNNKFILKLKNINR